MSGKILRVTMFKMPSEDSKTKMVELYKTLAASAVKHGKPYIISLEAGPTFDDIRSQGFNFVAKSEFASKGDMDYYDNECEAHQVLKRAAKELGITGMMVAYYTPAVVNAL